VRDQTHGEWAEGERVEEGVRNSRRLFSLWRITPFPGVASAVVGERLFLAWRAASPFPYVSLADFLHMQRYSRRASFIPVMELHLLRC
jgi:hypothetical protein